MTRRVASSADASRMSETWSAQPRPAFGDIGLLACVAHPLHRQDDEGEGRQEGSGVVDSHQPVDELGPAVGALDPATDASSMARWVSSMRAAATPRRHGARDFR
jgi:hypothetical protein